MDRKVEKFRLVLLWKFGASRQLSAYKCATISYLHPFTIISKTCLSR